MKKEEGGSLVGRYLQVSKDVRAQDESREEGERITDSGDATSNPKIICLSGHVSILPSAPLAWAFGGEGRGER